MSQDDEEFKLVVGHRSRGRVKYKKTGIKDVTDIYADQRAHGQHHVGGELTSAAAEGMVKGIRKEMKKIKYANDLMTRLKQLADETTKRGQTFRIICLGLGSPSRYAGSRHQLALLCMLSDKILCKDVSLYDPAFTATDITLFDSFNMSQLDVNNEGKIPCSDPDVFTLFYMPHCCRSLYANLLISNWGVGQLSNIAIIGNTFSNYLLHAIDASARKSTEAMRRLNPLMESFLLAPYPLHADCFSDTSLMIFPLQELEKHDIWNSVPPAPTLDHEMAVN
eukprot:TRINITY_DN11034_c0_g1_i1.p1 TRINITY_DN11034_c0_g1~~TRINITY_DN11034_c0_g1_i1.p1  ORF type:complete len:279 (+),score=25.92 TRINITY_DN11034_c0_g1_i1:94-930(+)